MRNFVFDLRSCDSLPPVGSAPHTQPTKTYLVWPQAVWLASSPSKPPRVLCLGHHVYVVPSYCRTFNLLLTLSRIFLPRLLTPEPLSHLLLIWVSAGVVLLLGHLQTSCKSHAGCPSLLLGCFPIAGSMCIRVLLGREDPLLSAPEGQRLLLFSRCYINSL